MSSRRLALIILAVTALPAAANFQQEMLKNKRTPAKENVQWTLADWLSQKNKMSLMDQWLAMHQSSRVIELILSGAGQQYSLKSDNGTTVTTTTPSAQNYQADLYLSLFTFKGEYLKTSDGKESAGGAGGLRLLGDSAQSTNLVARYGWRKLENLPTLERWENQYAEGALQLYIVREVGLTGEYRYYFPGTSNLGTRLIGYRVAFGPFIESSFLRVFANYFQEPLQLTANGAITRQTSSGFEGGLKLFF